MDIWVHASRQCLFSLHSGTKNQPCVFKGIPGDVQHLGKWKNFTLLGKLQCGGGGGESKKTGEKGVRVL